MICVVTEYKLWYFIIIYAVGFQIIIYNLQVLLFTYVPSAYTHNYCLKLDSKPESENETLQKAIN